MTDFKNRYAPHFPKSEKKYFNGPNKDLKVPVRRIHLSATHLAAGGVLANEPMDVYDTSGAWTDPDFEGSIKEGLPALRADWVMGRGDVEQAPKVPKVINPETHFEGLDRDALQAKTDKNVTQLHYARQGIITPEMEFVAIRENMGRSSVTPSAYQLSSKEGILSHAQTELMRLPNHQHPGSPSGANIPDFITPEFVRSEIAAGRAIIPANINHP